MKFFETYMKIAVEEARKSLREGNHGFGAVIILDGELICQTHDKEVTLQDPTSHAEMEAIRLASTILNGKLTGCAMISTHEPCPMCSSAIVWSGISQVIYGYSIEDSIKEERKRINIKCKEIFERAGAEIKVVDGVMKDECSILYNKDVRKSIKQLKDIDSDKAKMLSIEISQKRKDWFKNTGFSLINENNNTLENAYKIFLKKLGISSIEAPVIERSENKLVIHSKNFCPTLEACKILNLDTRYICKEINEKAMDALLKEIDPRLNFTRNYDNLRPFSGYCEEEIFILP